MTNATAMLRLTLQGERPKRAVARLARAASALARSAARELPMVLRKRVVLGAGDARAVLFEDLGDDRVHVVPFRTGGGATGALVADAAAGGLLVHGAFGGNAASAPSRGETTAAERAIVKRVAGTLVRAMSGAVPDARISLNGVHEPTGLDSQPLACVELPVERDGKPSGRLFFLVPLAALDESAPAPTPEVGDPRMVAVLSDVEVELVAELGRTRMPVVALSSLRVGDVVRLPVAESSAVCVRIGDKALFSGRPTTAGGRLAVELDGHET